MNHGSSSLEELSCGKNCSVRCTEHVGLSCGAYGGTSRWKRAIVDDNRGHGLESSGAAVRCLGRRISQATSGSAISLFSRGNGGELTPAERAGRIATVGSGAGRYFSRQD